MNKIDPYIFPSTVIVGNGEFPLNDTPCHVLDNARSVIICDGAANHYVTTGRAFDIIIGDGDSMSDDVRQQYASRIILSSCQETNDQTKAVNYLAQQGITHIAIVGATGRRDDHTIGNISLLIDYLSRGITAYIYTDHGIFIPAYCDNTFVTQPRQQISIFNFGSTQLSATGLKYPIRSFDSWWQGTLNEATDSSCTIHADGYYLIYLAYKQ